MIVVFEPYCMLLSSPPKWRLSYEQKTFTVTYQQLKLFLETYGYETNNILELEKFGINTKNIKHNKKL